MTEILDAVWNGFLIGFKYVGIAGGFIVGAYAAFLLADLTVRALERITEQR
jgi:hypothetical protein